MKLNSVSLKNFRSYEQKTRVDFGDLTAFVGHNDVGKSTVLEALDIFFNDSKGTVKLDKFDLNLKAFERNDLEIEIGVTFTELPEKVVLDASNETTLSNEWLLNKEQQLEIIKRYYNGGSPRVFIRAVHPSNPKCNDLLLQTPNSLRNLLDNYQLDCADRTCNAVMRQTIWEHFKDDLQLEVQEIEVSKSAGKSIWDKLQGYLPMYTLFQADRRNSDGDSEIQDPLREAVKEILKDSDIQAKLDEVAEVVQTKLADVAERTLSKLKEMDPSIAQTINPKLPEAHSLKWADVFKSVSITGDENLPINKRGSGVRRLVLLNFFRAEAERRQNELLHNSLIYAIEEPETAQHFDNQRKLAEALIKLSQAPNTQIIMTSHSAVMVKELDFDNLRIISIKKGSKVIEPVLKQQLPYPSLNEVNFLAFDEDSCEYHDELYGYLDEYGLLDKYLEGQPQSEYKNAKRNGKIEQLAKTKIIRNQIHHPENKLNERFTPEDLHASILAMREFIQEHKDDFKKH